MLGDISDEEVNDLIAMLSENVRSNLLSRTVVESQIFPVTHYIGVACYILYHQSFQYNVFKEIAKRITPEEIGKRSKCLASPLNQLAFYSLAMLYLHGRAQVINDNLYLKKKGNSNIIVEPEEKKKETKFVLDFWRRLSPNYLNSKTLTVEKKNLKVLTKDYVNKLSDQMIPVKENNRDIIKKLKECIAHLTIYNFLFQAECRAGIFEHGPYYIEDCSDPLVFKEFQYLYSGNEMYGIDITGILPQNITKPSPISNIIFGMTLKDMKKLEFNDWGTLFAEPSDFSSKITSIGIWTKDLIHPKDLRYPDNLGTLKPLDIDILFKLSDFAKAATRELYVGFARWNFTKKLMLGTGLYANSLNALTSGYAGIEDMFDWTWTLDYAEGKPFKTDLLDRDKFKYYIEKLKAFKYAGHPFLKRFFRGIKKRKANPTYYLLQS